jgi:succinyldiaminopimelate transaminase
MQGEAPRVAVSADLTRSLGRSLGRSGLTLPDFPWDLLAPYAQSARAHSGGIVDLSVGTPVDPVPSVVQAALAATTDTPGYPATYGTQHLREAAAGWLRRRHGVVGADPANVLPIIGAKEFVAWLPRLLGLGAGDVIGLPALAYPTYAVGATLAGAQARVVESSVVVESRVVVESTVSVGPAALAMLWFNSPGNPTGEVLGVDHLRKLVTWSRERGTILVSDECYLEFGWSAQPLSILHPEVCGDSHAGLIAVHSLSKRSNLAGYRAGFVTGDAAIVRELLEARKHAGMIVPAPVQAAMVAALDDDAHVDEQRVRYLARRAVLLAALGAAGFTVDGSQGGLYLWATRHEDCWETVSWLAARGILVAPGSFYGTAGRRHVRVALTATDERVAEAARRLTA